MNRYLVKPGSKLNLKDWDPNDTHEFKGSKEDAEKRLRELNLELDQLQEALYAEHKHAVLIILQAMDTGGEEGVIRHVFEGVNPQGVRVANFKQPTAEERDHDFLWRVHQQAPKKGDLVIFNRSHYEDVLVTRVHKLVSKDTWSARYKHIARFEKMLTDEGVTILKFFLHIDKEEQKKRLESRLKDPQKRWKFNPGDLEERKLWPEYREAYEDAIRETSTDFASWHIIPSNRKWYRNLMVASIIVDALKDLKIQYPKIRYNPAKIKVK